MNIDEKANDYIVKETEIVEEKQNNNNGNSNFIFDMLKAKTGSGTIESYNLHPLNFNNSKSIGQIVRGLSGMFGSLDFALIDIFVGILSIFKERRNGVNNDI